MEWWHCGLCRFQRAAGPVVGREIPIVPQVACELGCLAVGRRRADCMLAGGIYDEVNCGRNEFRQIRL